jgi:hypothetical protein
MCGWLFAEVALSDLLGRRKGCGQVDGLGSRGLSLLWSPAGCPVRRSPSSTTPNFPLHGRSENGAAAIRVDPPVDDRDHCNGRLDSCDVNCGGFHPAIAACARDRRQTCLRNPPRGSSMGLTCGAR